jgi:urea carboxylase
MSQVAVESEVQGNVWQLLVSAGDSVSAGDTLMILESMKVEIPVEAPVAGRVAEVLVAPEDAVAEDQVLVVIESG